MGYVFRLLSSHLQAIKEYRSNLQGSQVHCGIPSAYIVVTFSPCIALLTLRDGKHKVQY